MRPFLRLFLGLTICLLLGAVTLWLLRLPITTAALRHAGFTDPRIKSLKFVWPNTLAFEALSGDSDDIKLIVNGGNLSISGWRVFGKDLTLSIGDAFLILPENFPEADPEHSKRADLDPSAWLPPFSLALQKLTIIPRAGMSPWGSVSGELTSEDPERKLRFSAKTLAGDFELTGRVRPRDGEARVEWTSEKNPDWDEVFPYLPDWGITMPDGISATWRDLNASLNARWSEVGNGLNLHLQTRDLHLTQKKISLQSEPLEITLQMTGKDGDPQFQGNGQTSRLTITGNGNRFQTGEVETSIRSTEDGWTAKIEVSAGEATVSDISIDEITASFDISRGDKGDVAVVATGSARAFSGLIDSEITAQVAPFSQLLAMIHLSEVSLGEINEQFELFDGIIDAQVQGRVQAEWREGILTILPSELEMVPGTKGILQYENPGWMTKNPDLDLETLAEELRIDQLLRRSDGAGILVELAAQNLTVTRLRISLFDEDQKDREGEIDLEGFSMVQKTKIPVVLTIPLRGDLQESIRLLLQASGVM